MRRSKKRSVRPRAIGMDLARKMGPWVRQVVVPDSERFLKDHPLFGPIFSSVSVLLDIYPSSDVLSLVFSP